MSKEKTLVIIIKQRKEDSGGTITSFEEIGDKELVRVYSKRIIEETLRNFEVN